MLRMPSLPYKGSQTSGEKLMIRAERRCRREGQDDRRVPRRAIHTLLGWSAEKAFPEAVTRRQRKESLPWEGTVQRWANKLSGDWKKSHARFLAGAWRETHT